MLMIPGMLPGPYLLYIGAIPSTSPGLEALLILLPILAILGVSPGMVGVSTYPIPFVVINTLSDQDRFSMPLIVSAASLPHCFYGTSRSRSGSRRLLGFELADRRFDPGIFG